MTSTYPTARDSHITRIRRVGDSGLLVDVDAVETVHRLTAWLACHPRRADLVDVIPAARSVFVLAAEDILARIATDLRSAELPTPELVDARTLVVPVRYDGLDLTEVAERTGMSVGDVVRAHSETEHRVDFFGFSPGQAYFSGVPSSLRLPRRDSPRTRVPAGAVAIANEYTVIYPDDSPGGWNLLGTRVGPALWDSHASPPNRVSLGDHIVFTAVR